MRGVRRYLATEGISDTLRASAVATLPQLDARRRRVSIPQERPVEPPKQSQVRGKDPLTWHT